MPLMITVPPEAAAAWTSAAVPEPYGAQFTVPAAAAVPAVARATSAERSAAPASSEIVVRTCLKRFIEGLLSDRPSPPRRARTEATRVALHRARPRRRRPGT